MIAYNIYYHGVDRFWTLNITNYNSLSILFHNSMEQILNRIKEKKKKKHFIQFSSNHFLLKCRAAIERTENISVFYRTFQIDRTEVKVSWSCHMERRTTSCNIKSDLIFGAPHFLPDARLNRINVSVFNFAFAHI